MWLVKYLDDRNKLQEATVRASNCYKVARALYKQVGRRVAIISKMELADA